MNEIVKTSSNPMEAFQTRVLEKVREDIGKMLPDEVVEGLVKRAIDEQFFQPSRYPVTTVVTTRSRRGSLRK